MNYFKVFAGFPQNLLNNIIEIFKEETPVPIIDLFVILAERWKIYETFDKAFTYNPCSFNVIWSTTKINLSF